MTMPRKPRADREKSHLVQPQPSSGECPIYGGPCSRSTFHPSALKPAPKKPDLALDAATLRWCIKMLDGLFPCNSAKVRELTVLLREFARRIEKEKP